MSYVGWKIDSECTLALPNGPVHASQEEKQGLESPERPDGEGRCLTTEASGNRSRACGPQGMLTPD